MNIGGFPNIGKLKVTDVAGEAKARVGGTAYGEATGRDRDPVVAL
jgi:hypothetical protein